ncbi:MAG: hypothetical protein A3F13_00680 [Gammaproteobacteria bacterium RIFCSPHIGHO2_12_FULL_40_19]|nr:MAG: hypothetical protein A3F13_00680 [Gammaproteobacteria bacterium RIFCSPHIGHO2_12_FULL_40_19]
MKNVFKKGLVVLLASLFVTGVFAATTTVTTEAGAAPVAQHEHVKKHCTKKHCHTVNGKKVCKKVCKHHKHVVKKTTVTKAEPASTTETTTETTK